MGLKRAFEYVKFKMTGEGEILTTPNAKVLIVEDDKVLRQNLIDTVNGDPSLQLVGQADCVAAALEQITLHPDLILLDLGLPDGSGIDIIKAFRDDGQSVKTLVITVFEDKASVLRTLRAGADGYILKDTSPSDVLANVHSVLAGETPIGGRAAGHLLSILRDVEPVEMPSTGPLLTPRERQVLELMARGQSRKETARSLDLSPFTIAEYVQSIYRKLQVRSRGEAVYEAIQSRLIKLDDAKC
jgi:DNA-binding NarL/FixJ family response regulator